MLVVLHDLKYFDWIAFKVLHLSAIGRVKDKVVTNSKVLLCIKKVKLSCAILVILKRES